MIDTKHLCYVWMQRIFTDTTYDQTTWTDRCFSDEDHSRRIKQSDTADQQAEPQLKEFILSSAVCSRLNSKISHRGPSLRIQKLWQQLQFKDFLLSLSLPAAPVCCPRGYANTTLNHAAVPRGAPGPENCNWPSVWAFPNKRFQTPN